MLSPTRQLYGEEEFMTLFKLVLKQCMDKGLISGKRQAVDSVFFFGIVCGYFNRPILVSSL